MIVCLQKVLEAKVVVAGEEVAAIEQGLLVFLGIERGDAVKDAAKLALRVARYRCFPSEDGDKAMDRSCLDLGHQALVVSQFTLCADTRKGLRPGFSPAAAPLLAKPVYERFVEALRKAGLSRVETGVFAAHMLVQLVNDGPVTLLLEQAPS